VGYSKFGRIGLSGSVLSLWGYPWEWWMADNSSREARAEGLGQNLTQG